MLYLRWQCNTVRSPLISIDIRTYASRTTLQLARPLSSKATWQIVTIPFWSCHIAIFLDTTISRYICKNLIFYFNTWPLFNFHSTRLYFCVAMRFCFTCLQLLLTATRKGTSFKHTFMVIFVAGWTTLLLMMIRSSSSCKGLELTTSLKNKMTDFLWRRVIIFSRPEQEMFPSFFPTVRVLFQHQRTIIFCLQCYQANDKRSLFIGQDWIKRSTENQKRKVFRNRLKVSNFWGLIFFALVTEKQDLSIALCYLGSITATVGKLYWQPASSALWFSLPHCCAQILCLILLSELKLIKAATNRDKIKFRVSEDENYMVEKSYICEDSMSNRLLSIRLQSLVYSQSNSQLVYSQSSSQIVF